MLGFIQRHLWRNWMTVRGIVYGHFSLGAMPIFSSVSYPMHIRAELLRRSLACEGKSSTIVWCVIRPLPTLQSVIVARLPSRAEAEAHLTFLKRTRPDITYEIMFDAVAN
jgi:hypothetical protein